MTTYLKLFFVGFILLSVTSCGTTNNVSSNRLIQKRKYTRGFHFNRHSELSGKEKVDQIINPPNKTRVRLIFMGNDILCKQIFQSKKEKFRISYTS